MRVMSNRLAEYSTIFLRVALGGGFLSAVADRFGWRGPAGAKNVAWGNFDSFLAYTATLNPYLPGSLIPAVGWVATFVEVVLGVMLILGIRVWEVAALSGTLLLAFAVGMITGVGIKAPLDYSVFSAAAGACLLAVYGKSPLSVDALRGRDEHRSA